MSNNLKVWYILLEGQEEGPYSLSDLKQDRRLTPYVLVRKSGSKRWLPMGKVKLLRSVFKKEGTSFIEGTQALFLPPEADTPLTLIVFIVLLLVVWIVYNMLV